MLPQTTVESVQDVAARDEGHGSEAPTPEITEAEGALESGSGGETETVPDLSNGQGVVNVQPSESRSWYRVFLAQKAIEKLQTMVRPEWRVVPQQKYVFQDGGHIAVDGVIQGPEPEPDVIVEVKDLTSSLIKADRILAYAKRADDLVNAVSRRTGQQHGRLLILLVNDRDQSVAKAMAGKIANLITGADKFAAHYARETSWMEFWGDTSVVPFLRPWAARK